MRDLEFDEEFLGLLMVISKVVIAEDDQPGLTLEFRGAGDEQAGQLILLEVGWRPQDLGHAVAAGVGHHQRCVPGGGSAKQVRVSQQEAAGSPARFAETQQPAAAGLLECRVMLVDVGHDGLQQIRFLPDGRIGGMIGIPREVGKCRRDEDDRVLPLEFQPLDLGQAVSVALFLGSLDRQYIDDGVFSAWFQGLGKEHAEPGDASLEFGTHLVHQDSGTFPGGGCNLAGRRFCPGQADHAERGQQGAEQQDHAEAASRGRASGQSHTLLDGLDGVLGLLKTHAGAFSIELDGRNFLAAFEEADDLPFQVGIRGVHVELLVAFDGVDSLDCRGQINARLPAVRGDGRDALLLTEQSMEVALKRVVR